MLEMYFPYYTETEKLRHTVRPGLTGLAQINGRNDLKWDSRLSLDVEYVKSISFLLDCKIILKTIQKVIKREGVRVVDQGPLLSLDAERRNSINA